MSDGLAQVRLALQTEPCGPRREPQSKQNNVWTHRYLHLRSHRHGVYRAALSCVFLGEGGVGCGRVRWETSGEGRVFLFPRDPARDGRVSQCPRGQFERVVLSLSPPCHSFADLVSRVINYICICASCSGNGSSTGSVREQLVSSIRLPPAAGCFASLNREHRRAERRKVKGHRLRSSKNDLITVHKSFWALCGPITAREGGQ